MPGQLPESGLSQRPKTVVIGTAGHIDHGKTALIRALTGVDTDRLPEEKLRGITIDLGFASTDLTAADGSELRLSFIDVPGHARFVRNMLAGAGGIDAVLLVISAEEGVKPQTEEHLAICTMLGIRYGLTVLTKVDAVSEVRLNEVRSSVEAFLSTTFLASEAIVCASAYTGSGLATLRRELGSLAARIPARHTDSLMRLPLDRAFTMKGFGTVVTGTLVSGSVTTGQELAVEPGGRTAKVRGIQVHGHSAGGAEAATRVALNLSRIEASELHRGDTLVEPSTIAAVDTVDAEIRLLENAPALKHRARVHFHAHASECMATVSLYGYQPIEPNSARLARLRLSKPILLLPGDRFVLRQGSPVVTVGGGIVLDVQPIQRLNKTSAQSWLEQLREAEPDQRLALRVVRRGTAGSSISNLSAETGLKPAAIHTSLGSRIQSGSLHIFENDLFVAREALLEAVAMADRELVTLFGEAGSVGVKRSALSSRLKLPLQVLDWALRQLERDRKLRIQNDLLVPPATDHAEDTLDQQKLSAISRAYERAGLASPSPSSLAAELALDTTQMRRLMTVLLREKKLVRLGDDSLCVHQNALDNMRQQVRALRGQTMDVARFKQLTGVSRKYAIPLLEYLDRERVTRKQGDLRIVL